MQEHQPEGASPPLHRAARHQAALTQVEAAFSAAAPSYDHDFGHNPVGRLFRSVFQKRLVRLFPAGARVLDLGCGTGEDALFLASRGVLVHALDVAPGMVAATRAKAAARAVAVDRLCVEQRRAEDVGSCGTGFDGAYSNFGALNCADLRAVGLGLAEALRPGAPVLLSVMGRWPLPALLAAALRGRGRPRGEHTPRVHGVPVPTEYPSARRVRRLLGGDFAWYSVAALGVLVPDPGYARWLERHARTLAWLALAEGKVRSWPGLRQLGDHTVLEGVRL